MSLNQNSILEDDLHRAYQTYSNPKKTQNKPAAQRKQSVHLDTVKESEFEIIEQSLPTAATQNEHFQTNNPQRVRVTHEESQASFQPDGSTFNIGQAQNQQSIRGLQTQIDVPSQIEYLNSISTGQNVQTRNQQVAPQASSSNHVISNMQDHFQQQYRSAALQQQIQEAQYVQKLQEADAQQLATAAAMQQHTIATQQALAQQAITSQQLREATARSFLTPQVNTQYQQVVTDQRQLQQPQYQSTQAVSQANIDQYNALQNQLNQQQYYAYYPVQMAPQQQSQQQQYVQLTPEQYAQYESLINQQNILAHKQAEALQNQQILEQQRAEALQSEQLTRQIEDQKKNRKLIQDYEQKQAAKKVQFKASTLQNLAQMQSQIHQMPSQKGGDRNKSSADKWQLLASTEKQHRATEVQDTTMGEDVAKHAFRKMKTHQNNPLVRDQLDVGYHEYGKWQIDQQRNRANSQDYVDMQDENHTRKLNPEECESEDDCCIEEEDLEFAIKSDKDSFDEDHPLKNQIAEPDFKSMQQKYLEDVQITFETRYVNLESKVHDVFELVDDFPCSHDSSFCINLARLGKGKTKVRLDHQIQKLQKDIYFAKTIYPKQEELYKHLQSGLVTMQARLNSAFGQDTQHLTGNASREKLDDSASAIERSEFVKLLSKSIEQILLEETTVDIDLDMIKGLSVNKVKEFKTKMKGSLLRRMFCRGFSAQDNLSSTAKDIKTKVYKLHVDLACHGDVDARTILFGLQHLDLPQCASVDCNDNQEHPTADSEEAGLAIETKSRIETISLTFKNKNDAKLAQDLIQDAWRASDEFEMETQQTIKDEIDQF